MTVDDGGVSFLPVFVETTMYPSLTIDEGVDKDSTWLVFSFGFGASSSHRRRGTDGGNDPVLILLLLFRLTPKLGEEVALLSAGGGDDDASPHLHVDDDVELNDGLICWSGFPMVGLSSVSRNVAN